ncbi:LADA_0E09450g1_1 [Lachancea dasiensis]|uniref:LADA_0E09450g1_1 n=1 Tax=Lachancea dasiensis TaxID=1072105 RepID=A0A1G4JDS6_9SACH|nr:LADA_0E09450g1_1 [Lachancea dasiensis]
MGKEVNNPVSPASKGKAAQKTLNVSKEQGAHTFLKVAPGLFTADKLPLFDDLELYTTLIRSSKALEQGERLHNLSWRIMNKALLKDHEVNKSKRRDGVKNLYRVINPAQNAQPLHTNVKKPVDRVPAMQVMSAMRNSTSEPRTPQDSRHRNLIKAHDVTPQHVQYHGGDFSHPQALPTRAISELQVRRDAHKPHHDIPAPLSRIDQRDQRDVRFTLGFENGSQISSPETPQHATTGFQIPATQLKKKDIASRHHAGHPDVIDGPQHRKKPIKKNNLLSRAPESLFATRADDRAPESDKPGARSILLERQPKSLFGQRPQSTQDRVFHDSSDEDESDWDSLSDDSQLYDEEEDDIYYQKQWDKLMFPRNDSLRTNFNKSTASSTTSVDHQQDPKRSLLSGLFLSEMNKKPTPQIMSSWSLPQQPTLEESSIVAVGDVTPSSSWKGTDAISHAISRDHIPAQRNSFSSIISDSTRQRYTFQSNAPPTAQTILPTALSTHMFLPNNVHQQRIAKSESLRSEPVKRRESMDIPSKKTSSRSLLKTRHEISEEEYFARGNRNR